MATFAQAVSTFTTSGNSLTTGAVSAKAGALLCVLVGVFKASTDATPSVSDSVNPGNYPTDSTNLRQTGRASGTLQAFFRRNEADSDSLTFTVSTAETGCSITMIALVFPEPNALSWNEDVAVKNFSDTATTAPTSNATGAAAHAPAVAVGGWYNDNSSAPTCAPPADYTEPANADVANTDGERLEACYKLLTAAGAAQQVTWATGSAAYSALLGVFYPTLPADGQGGGFFLKKTYRPRPFAPGLAR